MNRKTNGIHSRPAKRPRAQLKHVSRDPVVGDVIGVRAAKAHLSELIEIVATGRDIVITRDGTPTVRLVSYLQAPRRKVFGGAEQHLASMPPWKGGRTAEQIIRDDRDARGW
jgi:prevent-host-death family protein